MQACDAMIEAGSVRETEILRWILKHEVFDPVAYVVSQTGWNPAWFGLDEIRNATREEVEAYLDRAVGGRAAKKAAAAQAAHDAYMATMAPSDEDIARDKLDYGRVAPPEPAIILCADPGCRAQLRPDQVRNGKCVYCAIREGEPVLAEPAPKPAPRAGSDWSVTWTPNFEDP
jgi:hypothetical protein